MYRNRKRKSWLSYLVLLLIAGTFLATIGIRLLVSAIQIVTDIAIGERDDSPNISTGDFFAPPDIIDIPDATSSAAIKITGTAPDNATIYVYVNNVQKRKLLSENGTFQTKLSLTRTENSIYVEAQNPKTGESKRSTTYTVILIKEGPILSIESPVDNQIVAQSSITVKGSVSADTTVTVNGVPTVINGSGGFSQEISLNTGENKIRVIATDIAGNTKEAVLTIIYEP